MERRNSLFIANYHRRLKRKDFTFLLRYAKHERITKGPFY